MKMVDADAFYEELRRHDLEFMQQSDLMACIRDILDRQPAALPPQRTGKIPHSKAGRHHRSPAHGE